MQQGPSPFPQVSEKEASVERISHFTCSSGDVLPWCPAGISAPPGAGGTCDEIGRSLDDKLVCVGFECVQSHLVGLYFPNLAAKVPHTPRAIPTLCSMVLSFQTRLKCHFLSADFSGTQGCSGTSFSEVPQHCFFILTLGAAISCIFLFEFTFLSPLLYKSLKVMLHAPFTFCAVRTFHNLAHTKCSLNS